MKQAKTRGSPRNQRYIEPEQPTPLWQKLFDLDQIESLLQASAREGKAISYAETLNSLGLEFSRPKMRALCAVLGEIDRRAAKRGEPELAVLVVRASDKIPGAGWWAEKNMHDYKGPWEGPKAEKFIRAIQKEAFEYWKKR
ncbi:MAG TPA: hypothetical protein VFS88_07530 [Micavibrio sp.]|nr:hypothetical protein [Micavibrio sp.]